MQGYEIQHFRHCFFIVADGAPGGQAVVQVAEIGHDDRISGLHNSR